MANGIDAVLLSLKIDTREVKTGIADISKRLGELEKSASGAARGVAETSPAGAAAVSSLNTLAETVKKTALAYFSLRGAARMASDYISNALGMGYAAQNLNENIETVNAFGEAAARNGGSVQGFQNSLASLTDKMRKARLEGEAGIYTPLARLGVGGFNADTKGSDMMLRIADRMKGLSNAAALTFGRELGFDDATIRTLQQGRAEVEKLIVKYKELGVYSQKDFEAARKLKTAMQDLRQSFAFLATQTMRTLTPALQWIAVKLNDITRWIRDNEQFVRAFFIGLAVIITAAAIPAILKMAAASLAAFAPLLLIGAIIALLADDFLTWKNGGRSALGAVYEKMEPLVDKLEDIWEKTRELREEFGKLALEFLAFSANALIDGLVAALSLLAAVAIKLQEIIDKYNVLGWLKNTKKEYEKGFLNGLHNTAEEVGIGMWGIISPRLAEYFAEQKAARELAEKPSQSATNNNSDTRISIGEMNITVPSNATPEQIGETIRSALPYAFSGATQ
jgi:hypothetical protein